jgi:hypothetical protein
MPPPGGFRILSITPSEQSTTESQSVTVRLDTNPRFLVDYGEQSVQMIDQPVLEIGSQTVPLDTYLGHGQFQGTVGSGLEAGRYEIRVKLGDGREATLPDAYEVKPAEEPVPPVGYWLESIGPQVQGRPFTITIHATGPDAKHFEGMVTVKLYKSGVPTGFSIRSPSFSAGVCQQQLTIDTPSDHYLIFVLDEQGYGATSNTFRVVSKD